MAIKCTTACMPCGLLGARVLKPASRDCQGHMQKTGQWCTPQSSVHSLNVPFVFARHAETGAGIHLMTDCTMGPSHGLTPQSFVSINRIACPPDMMYVEVILDRNRYRTTVPVHLNTRMSSSHRRKRGRLRVVEPKQKNLHLHGRAA